MLGNVLSEDTAINFLHVLFLIQFFHREYKSLWWVRAPRWPLRPARSRAPCSSPWAGRALWPRKQLCQAFRDCSLHFLSLRLFALKAADMQWGCPGPRSTLLAELCWQLQSPARSRPSQVVPQPSSGAPDTPGSKQDIPTQPDQTADSWANSVTTAVWSHWDLR